mmetsp:Transcript_16951/g.22197  ORF Transcript_16951/g.22197 Transcript_16951/m.22197 type:complete len:102 (-) Transcript_16951:441-746(-)
MRITLYWRFRGFFLTYDVSPLTRHFLFRTVNRCFETVFVNYVAGVWLESRMNFHSLSAFTLSKDRNMNSQAKRSTALILFLTSSEASKNTAMTKLLLEDAY